MTPPWWNRGAGALVVRCRCGKSISVAREHRGKRIKCKQCGRELRVGGGPRLPAQYEIALTVLSVGYLAAVCVLAAMLWGFGDVWWPATVLLFIGRWGFLLPLIVLVPAALVFRRALLVPLAVGALMCVGPLMGGRTGWRRLLSHAPGTALRVLTYNTDGGDIVAASLPAYITDTHPDFVALQECGATLAHVVAQLPGWYHHQVRQLCFLSRYPLLDSAVMDRSALEKLKESDAGIGGSGDVVRYAIQLPHDTITFTNLHLETPRKGLEGVRAGTFAATKLDGNTELRRIESDLAAKWVRAGTGPVIVAGDFNTPVESRIFQGSWGALTDAFSRAGFGFGMTKLNGWIRVRIDHVLTGARLYPDHVELGPDLGSDHLPLVVDMTLVRGR